MREGTEGESLSSVSMCPARPSLLGGCEAPRVAAGVPTQRAGLDPGVRSGWCVFRRLHELGACERLVAVAVFPAHTALCVPVVGPNQDSESHSCAATYI